MYWHDLHDIINIYEERGNHPPLYLKKKKKWNAVMIDSVSC